MRLGANRLVVVLLSLNAAAMLLLILLHFSSPLLPTANAQTIEPSSAGLSVMPAQLSGNTWGCYLLDTRSQTLCVYQYSPGEKLLRLQAARGFSQDLELKSFNTMPQPKEVAALLELERRLQGGAPATMPAISPDSDRK